MDIASSKPETQLVIVIVINIIIIIIVIALLSYMLDQSWKSFVINLSFCRENLSFVFLLKYVLAYKMLEESVEWSCIRQLNCNIFHSRNQKF